MDKRTSELHEYARNVPKSKIEESSRLEMQRRIEERFKAQMTSIEDRRQRIGKDYERLRLASNALPGWGSAREALYQGLKERHADLRNRPILKAPNSSAERRARSGRVVGRNLLPPNLPNITIDFTPPYSTMQSVANYGGVGLTMAPTTDALGDCTVFLEPGWPGWGLCSCMVGFSEVVRLPANYNFLFFDVSPSYSWLASWTSDWWVIAAGQLDIFVMLNRVDPNHGFLGNLYQSWKNLTMFDDANFSDSGFLSGDSPGDPMNAGSEVLETAPNADSFVQCIVGLYAAAYADLASLGSTAIVSAGASVDWMTVTLQSV